MLDFDVFSDFESAAQAVLAFLHQRLGLSLWMLTRTEGEDWIVLQAQDQGYGVKAGDVFRWRDSFCSQMVAGRGPRIAADSNQVSVYANAPIAQQVAIGAYVGVPLTYKDGRLFGTLCAIDPQPQTETLAAELPLVELLARLLSSLLSFSLEVAEQARQAERACTDAVTDALTGLYNRRGWEQFLAQEEERCRIYGHPASVIIIDLDGLKEVNDSQGHGAGDQLIIQTAEVLRHTVRCQDIVARLGGDEFAVLCLDCGLEPGKALLERLEEAFMERQIDASLGLACRKPGAHLTQAVEEADHAMYLCKSWRKNG
ncbi:sensor domain-containing diguanylate cyclase [Synechocystis sp. LKSZ1]|uniref:sensor domain-containing diguanylate cyclase n=1 Tax=Synechocystis sp. LKSZ1 TaxID=3144951 RepID=UPI00336BB6D8